MNIGSTATNVTTIKRPIKTSIPATIDTLPLQFGHFSPDVAHFLQNRSPSFLHQFVEIGENDEYSSLHFAQLNFAMVTPYPS
jgi:hypothetical protein